MSVAGSSNSTPRAQQKAPVQAKPPPKKIDDSDSDEEMTTPTVNDMTKEEAIKFSKPDLYHGERKGLDGWLLQVDLYLKYKKTTEEKKTIFAAAYLRGDAEEWFKSYLRPYLEDGTDEEGVFKSYKKFKEEIRRFYGISNEKQAAERNIQFIAQKTSAAEYSARFVRSSNLTEWDDEALMAMYRRGFKPHVKEELMRWGGALTDLKELMEASIELNDKYYELQQETRRMSYGRAGTYVGIGIKNKGPKPSKSTATTNSGYYGSGPMELAVAHKEKSSILEEGSRIRRVSM